MERKKLKYKSYLEKFPNCPPADFKEVDRKAFRWTHQPFESVDFLPVNLISEPPARMLDELDKMCMAYGLSMFDTLQNSVEKYKKEYKKRRPHQRKHFIQDKGSCITTLELRKEDGIADFPNEKNYGHFTFYEYTDFDIAKCEVTVLNIFNDDGEIIL